MPKMFLLHEGTGIRFIKFCLVIFNIALIITGISLIIVGTTINSIYGEFSSFLASIYFSPATILVSVGFIIFGINSLGFLGTIKESTSILMAFGTLLGVVSLLQLFAGISNSSLMSSIDKNVLYNLNKTLYSYGNDEKSQLSFDNLQQELHCCGISGPKDWGMIFKNDSIPESCCALEVEDKCSTTFNRGCYLILGTIILESSKMLTLSAYFLSLSQIFGVFFSFYLAKMLRAQKLAREYRKWAIRRQLITESAYLPNYINATDIQNKADIK